MSASYIPSASASESASSNYIVPPRASRPRAKPVPAGPFEPSNMSITALVMCGFGYKWWSAHDEFDGAGRPEREIACRIIPVGRDGDDDYDAGSGIEDRDEEEHWATASGHKCDGTVARSSGHIHTHNRTSRNRVWRTDES